MSSHDCAERSSIAKRLCLRVSSDCPKPSHEHDFITALCLLPLLQPVRHCLHRFLSAEDAARLMQTSRCTAAALLSGYAFVDHAFLFNRRSVADVKRCLALCARFHTRIQHMCLPRDWNEPLVDASTGRPVLPPSLLALVLGQNSTEDERRPVAYVPSNESIDDEESEQCHEVSYRRVRPHGAPMLRSWPWDVLRYSGCVGRFGQPIPPGALPHGLRFLQFNDTYDQPLQDGSIPSTVEVLQLSWRFNQPLQVGHLPASLTHLVLGFRYEQPLLPGQLPAGLLRLHLGGFNYPLQPGILPPLLLQLSFGQAYNQPLRPGVIPASVVRLRLSERFDQPLQMGSIPEGVVHLNLGWCFDQPLLRGALPSSLRELVIGHEFNQPLQPGSLPDGLEVLVFSKRAVFRQPLLPGVIPASVIAISMGKKYRAELVAGAIPATVKWLRLSTSYKFPDLSATLAPSTHVEWW